MTRKKKDQNYSPVALDIEERHPKAENPLPRWKVYLVLASLGAVGIITAILTFTLQGRSEPRRGRGGLKSAEDIELDRGQKPKVLASTKSLSESDYFFQYTPRNAFRSTLKAQCGPEKNLVFVHKSCLPNTLFPCKPLSAKCLDVAGFNKRRSEARQNPERMYICPIEPSISVPPPPDFFCSPTKACLQFERFNASYDSKLCR